MRFEPIAAMPLRATYGVLDANDSIEFAQPRDYADWGTGPIDIGHILAGNLDTLRKIVATPGRAHYSNVGPRRRGPRRSSFVPVGGRDLVIPKHRMSPVDRVRTTIAFAALAFAVSLLPNAILMLGQLR